MCNKIDSGDLVSKLFPVGEDTALRTILNLVQYYSISALLVVI